MLCYVMSLKFSLSTSNFGHCTCKFPHSTFNFSIELLPARQRPIDIVVSIDLTHPRSNGGRESVETQETFLHSRQLEVDRRVHERMIKAADRQDAAACTC